MKKNINRRDFIRRLGGLGLLSYGVRAVTAEDLLSFCCFSETQSDIIIASNRGPEENTYAAIEAIGGMEQFIKPGEKVLINPNLCSHLPFQTAANTHPLVVKAVVKLCQKAGAKEVVIGNMNSSKNYRAGGLYKVAAETGAILKPLDSKREFFTKTAIPQGIALKEVLLSQDYLNCDVLINIPIAKHHSAAGMSLSLKNKLGLVTDIHPTFHREGDRYLAQSIADLNTVVKAKLTVMDANKVLVKGGPIGPGETVEPKKVIVGRDAVAIDAWAANFFKLSPKVDELLCLAVGHGLGQADLKKIKIKEI